MGPNKGGNDDRQQQGDTARRSGLNSDGPQQQPDVQLSEHLSARDMEIMAWHYHDGRSYAEIGQLLGITKQSVHDRIKRGTAALEAMGLPVPPHPRTRRVGRPIPMDPGAIRAISDAQVDRSYRHKTGDDEDDDEDEIDNNED